MGKYESVNLSVNGTHGELEFDSVQTAQVTSHRSGYASRGRVIVCMKCVCLCVNGHVVVGDFRPEAEPSHELARRCR